MGTLYSLQDQITKFQRTLEKLYGPEKDEFYKSKMLEEKSEKQTEGD
jgi:hypothetical protein